MLDAHAIGWLRVEMRLLVCDISYAEKVRQPELCLIQVLDAAL
jgi:hypothetical protein